MKRKTVTVLLLMAVVLSGCSSSTSNTASKDVSVKTQEDSKEIEVEKELFDVKVTIPASALELFSEEDPENIVYSEEEINNINEAAKEGGYKVEFDDENKTATYIMTKSQHKKVVQEVKKTIEDACEEMTGSEDYPNVTDIKISDNCKNYTVTTKSKELSFEESFLILPFYYETYLYYKFQGKEVDNVSVEYINDETGEVIETINSKDF